MNREQERIRKNLEKNPVAECNKIQKKSRKFNDEQIVENLYSFLGERKKAMKQIYLSQLIKQFRNCFFHSCVLHWNKCVFRK